MNFLGPLGAFHQAVQKHDELMRSMPLRGHAMHFTGLDVESCIQGKCAVTIVFKAMPLGSTRRQWQHWVQPIQRLNGRLLIYAKHGSMLWIHV